MAESKISSSGFSDENPMVFLPKKNGQAPMEQNMVQYCVDQTFAEQKHRIYKKSIKSDGQGKYLELSFISPEVGRRYKNLLSTLASQIQWRIYIADSVNQKEVFGIVPMLCCKYGISLRQNPSYLPQKRAIQLRADKIPSKEVCQNLAAEILELTGLCCTIAE